VTRPSRPRRPKLIDELEVKARVTDVRALRRSLRRAGARLEFRGRMIDRRFDRRRELIRRDEVLRLRVYRPTGRRDRDRARAVLAWKGAASTRRVYRHRRELEVGVADANAIVMMLARLRYRVTQVIDRRVEIYRLGRAVLRLERYPRMDTLLEVEGPPPAIERAIAATGLPRGEFLSESLPYFVAAYRRRTGRRARLAAGDPRP
jgi:adenylate cyclase class IV